MNNHSCVHINKLARHNISIEKRTEEEYMEEEFCTCAEHKQAVEELRTNMIDEEVLYDVADLFKIFADSTRLKILYSLFHDELCVCDIADALNMSQSSISHQLRTLKQSRLVKYRREGKSVYYSLADDHVKTIIYQGIEHSEE